MTYNMDFLDNATGFTDLVVGVDNLTGNTFFLVFMIVISILIMIIGIRMQQDIKKVILADGFITSLLGVLLWSAGLTGFLVITYPLLLLITGILLTVFGGD